jgi:hypothetical protein
VGAHSCPPIVPHKPTKVGAGVAVDNHESENVEAMAGELHLLSKVLWMGAFRRRLAVLVRALIANTDIRGMVNILQEMK